MRMKEYLCVRKLWRPLFYCTFLLCFLILNFGGIFQQINKEEDKPVLEPARPVQYAPFISADKVLQRVVEAEQFYRKSDDKSPSVWPRKEILETNDRIVAQLNYVPPNYDASGPAKLIVYPQEQSSVLSARRRLVGEQCLVQNCNFSSSRSDIMRADAVIIKGQFGVQSYASLRHPRQVWIMSQLESPFHGNDFSQLSKQFNWTATYRRDSVLVTPYEKFVTFANYTNLPEKPPRNYAQNKTKLVAWFVSNCNAKNGRDRYVKELRKYIEVDIYGSCGPFKCRRSDQSCFRMLSEQYKFYLSFENSNCKDYITEKLYWNAYLNDVVPIVMGAHPEDYKAVAPPSSFIHVDDFKNPAALAQYLKLLHRDDALYNSYFRWKGTGEFINTKFWCRICSMVHGALENPFWYGNVQRWWQGPEVCTRPSENNGLWASWNNFKGNTSALLSNQFGPPVRHQHTLARNGSGNAYVEKSGDKNLS